MDHEVIGKYIIITGAVIFGLGLLYYILGDKLHWIGRLPGDIYVKKENFSFYFPLTTMILLSIVLSVLAKIIQNWK